MSCKWLIPVMFAAVLLAACSEEKNEPEPAQKPELPPLPVEFITVSNEQVPVWVEYTGKTEATQRVDIAARVSGTLEQVLFKEGDYVRQGDTLFIIEKDLYEAALAKARANHERNQASLALAVKDVERYTPLVAEDLAPRATLDQYKARVAELEAALKADEAAIKDAEVNLGYTEIQAPLSGRIGRTLIDAGNLVGPGAGAVLATIVSDDPMYVYFHPTEQEFQIMRQYKSQDRMEAIANVPGDSKGLITRETYKGVIDFSDNRVDQGTGTITMRAAVANPDHTLLEGTFVYVGVMVTDSVALVLIPPGAVQEDQLGSFVYIADENDTARRITIKSGYQSRNYLIVTEGLNGGERLLVNGFAKLRPEVRLALTDVTDTKGVRALFREQGMLPAEE